MLLKEVAVTSREVAATRSRLRKVDLLAACLRRLDPAEVAPGVAFLSGDLPRGRVGVGWATLREARPEEAAPEPRLTLLQVAEALDRVAAVSGKGSAAARLEEVRSLLARATAEEQDFLVKLLFGELRQGALEGVMVDAVARAADLPAASVRRALMLAGDLGPVASAALREGEAGLARFALTLFRPLKPMLAETARDVAEALGRLGRAAFEFKLDGARVQVHRSGQEVRVFTRGLNDVTGAVPEVVEQALGLPVREVVLDGEVLALRRDGTPHPFQVTMSRFGRRLDVAEQRRALPLSAFYFDCLHLDGRTLLDAPASERIAALAAAVPEAMRMPRIVTSDVAEGEAFLARALEAGHEGLMAKALDAPYEAGGRGQAWLKIKTAHTLDLVVLAAEWGSGRRRGWLSNLHLGARDPETGGFVMLGKTFKGLTDRTLQWQTRRLQELEVSRDAWTVYVRPELVVEVAFSDVQASPHYPAGMALRFARVKGYREDKRPEEADTLDTVQALHRGTWGQDAKL